jgi:two-component system NtrC family sensor kinase
MNTAHNSQSDNHEEQSVVIVDDSPDNLRLLVGILSERGYKVRPAPSGVRALATVRRDPPELILLDIMMPDIDGYEVCRQLKADKQTQDIPVIFLSALDEVFNKVKAFKVGGVDYITKPFQVEEVLARVNTHLCLHSLQRCLEKKNLELQTTLDEVKQLRGLLPICQHCKKIRIETPGEPDCWQTVEEYFSRENKVKFSHGICNDCLSEYYPEVYKRR